MLIKLVIPAKATEIKKNRAKRLPSGICLNTSGRVKNIKLGPLTGSMPKENTAGIMASAASIAAIVSNTAVCTLAFGISTSSFKYAPYTIIPEPVMDKEKKACPMAMIHVSLLSKHSHLGTNKNL